VAFYNLLDRSNEINVYTSSGTAKSPGDEFSDDRFPYNQYRIITLGDYYNQPDWYLPPRRIQIGMEIVFHWAVSL
jgi:hypothetical protein